MVMTRMPKTLSEVTAAERCLRELAVYDHYDRGHASGFFTCDDSVCKHVRHVLALGGDARSDS